MSKLNFTYRKLTVALAIVALALLANIYPTPGARPQARAAVADLTAEKQTLASFANDLGSLEKKTVELLRRSSITSTELDSAKTSASILKSKVSQTQQAFQSAINKLKAAREWEKYDAFIEQQYANSRLLPLIREEGGAKRMLETVAAQASGLSSDIDALIQPLNSRVAATGSSFGHKAQLGFMPVRASFTPAASTHAAPAVFKSVRCYFRVAGYVLLGGDEREARAQCACLTNTSQELREGCEASGYWTPTT